MLKEVMGRKRNRIYIANMAVCGATAAMSVPKSVDRRLLLTLMFVIILTHSQL